MAETYRIGYVGAGGSGRSTSLHSVLAFAGCAISKSEVTLKEHTFGLSIDEIAIVFTAAVDTFRGWLPSNSPNPGLVAELDRLPTFDGFVFVVDSRAFRMEAGANHDALSELRTGLRSRGRELDAVPVVFQANFRDQPDAIAMPAIKSQFSVPRCDYCETAAIAATGVVVAVERLARLIAGGSDRGS